MIEADFVGITGANLITNDPILDDYYSQNLDYEVLNEIAVNPQIYDNLGKNSTKNRDQNELWNVLTTMLCTINKTKEDFGWIRAAYSYYKVTPKAQTLAQQQYAGLDVVESNTTQDAYRHMLWNAMLAKYYFTISAKSSRLAFAKKVTDLREGECNQNLTNPVDQEAMDLHNNAIGRKIWDSTTEYSTFWGMTVGLTMKKTSELMALCFDRINRESCFIVKDEVFGTTFDYTEQEVQSEISLIRAGAPVYFNGPIVPQYQTYVTIGYQNVPCGDGDVSISEGEDGSGTQICVEAITQLVTIKGCYISKDPNYNPYINEN